MSEINLAGKHALIADDEPFVRSLVLRMLKDLGDPKVEVANDGEEALRALASRSSAIDFALIDFNMPKMNGLAVLKAARTGRLQIRRDLPIAMLTGNSDSSLVQKAMALDVNAFVVKPASRATLASRIERMLHEDPYIQDAEIYASVELPEGTPAQEVEAAPSAVILDSTRGRGIGVALASRPAVDTSNFGPKVRRTIDDVPENALLCADVENRHGICLLRQGVHLNRRFLSRLRDIAEAENVKHVWVRLPQ